MMLDRRSILLGGLALTAAPALAARILARADLFEWKRLRDGAVATGGMTTGGNVLAAKRGGGILFVDAKFAGLAPTLRAEGARALSGDAAMLINTHHHADHTSGNIAFDDLDHIAHANAAPRIESQHKRYLANVADGPERVREADGDDQAVKRAEALANRAEPKIASWLPARLIKDAMTRLDLDGLEIVLHHVGPGHTDNDLIVQFPQLNLVHTGDLVFHRIHPYIDRPAGATTRGWIESCQHIAELCDDDTVVVPGHGGITDKSGVLRQIEYFQRARTEAKRAVESGISRQAFASGDFEFASDYPSQRKELSLGTIYDEVAEGE